MRKSVKWGLVAYTVVLFLFLSTRIVINRYQMFAEYIGNRGFPGDDDFPPGPVGYEVAYFAVSTPTNVYTTMFPLSQWLAGGLLVSSILKSAAWISYVVHSSSYIVVMSFLP